MTLTPHRQKVRGEVVDPVEMLIKEARERSRRRRLRVLFIASLALLCAASYLTFRDSNAPSRPSSETPSNESHETGSAAADVSLRHPYGLTVAPNGSLYVVDTARDQVLRRLDSGKFVVVAGDGHHGFSGDGGSATRAALRLNDESGIVISKSGVLYISDTGNDRVRAVLKNGTIETVAGNGRQHNELGITSATPALMAPLGQVFGLTFGPNGDLYIAGANVTRLTPKGEIYPVTDNRDFARCVAQCFNYYRDAGLDDPTQVAFDREGNLFFSGCAGWGLCEVTKSGSYLYLGNLRGDGMPGDIVETRYGDILEASREGLVPAMQGKAEVIRVNLNRALGPMDGGPRENTFIQGDGLAVGSNGDVYLDTDAGNTFTSVSALVEVKSDDDVITLWKS